MDYDLDHLKSWVGRTDAQVDLLTPRLAQAFEATFDRQASFRSGDAAPLGIHWCLGNPALPASGLGRDGHPKRQGIMPPVPLPRRMWAGGDLAFRAPLCVAAQVTRVSTIASIDSKQGRTGPLIFLVAEHRYEQDGQACLTERRSLVFREDPKPGEPTAEDAPSAPAGGEAVLTITPDSVMLFRYSALTFNGHRIHYDQAYAREVEGYPNIVVHGPLIATLLLQAAATSEPDRRLESFSFRARSPSFAGRPLQVSVEPNGSGAGATATSEGRIIMTAEARFAEQR
jgi:3-methylfumaryl-CoA hydratase